MKRERASKGSVKISKALTKQFDTENLVIRMLSCGDTSARVPISKNPKLMIAHSSLENAGLGLFARGSGIVFKKDEFICTVRGTFVPKKDYPTDKWEPYLIEVGDKTQYLSVKPEGSCLARYINTLFTGQRSDKRRLNAEIILQDDGEEVVIATRDITNNGEIYTDYSASAGGSGMKEEDIFVSEEEPVKKRRGEAKIKYRYQ